MNVLVHHRFPAFEATIRTNQPAAEVRRRVAGLFTTDASGGFELRSRRGGLTRSLRPWITGRLQERADGSDIVFRAAYPRGWWVLTIAVAALMTAYSMSRRDPTLLPLLAALVVIATVSLPLRGTAFARAVERALRQESSL